ncbi:MAG: 8-oxoguanine DNA glycosylase [Clostridiales Family XIII bacterium]|nr:8-oxoguanine DNA glycosylase [Clostridiales Family XIII bacterium]
MTKQVFENVRDFDLDDIFDCGQCFRWNKQPDGSYSGVVEGSFANISFLPSENGEAGGRVTIWSNRLAESPSLREKFWRNYLDLDRDYDAIKRLLSTEDAVMGRAIKTCGGIRILNQNKWETLISFLISQNNNIPRIKACIERLCVEQGRRIGRLRGKPIYAFPSVDRLSVLREEHLADCRLGYRAKYIVETARRIAYDGGAFLSTGEQMPIEKIEEYLLSLSGVGPKVANCVMLFSMKKSEVFPLDVWVRRVMNRLYGMGEENVSAMKDCAKRNFGSYGGIAQQYLFHYIRTVARDNPALYERLRLEESDETDGAAVPE